MTVGAGGFFGEGFGDWCTASDAIIEAVHFVTKIVRELKPYFVEGGGGGGGGGAAEGVSREREGRGAFGLSVVFEVRGWYLYILGG